MIGAAAMARVRAEHTYDRRVEHLESLLAVETAALQIADS
jgi:hypothetical protein